MSDDYAPIKPAEPCHCVWPWKGTHEARCARVREAKVANDVREHLLRLFPNLSISYRVLPAAHRQQRAVDIQLIVGDIRIGFFIGGVCLKVEWLTPREEQGRAVEGSLSYFPRPGPEEWDSLRIAKNLIAVCVF